MRARNGLAVVLFFWFLVVLFPESCVGRGNWVLQRLRQGLKNGCRAPRGGARSPPAPACPRGAWTNTSRSGVGTLDRERRQKAPVSCGRRPRGPGRPARAQSRALASRPALPCAGERRGGTRPPPSAPCATLTPWARATSCGQPGRAGPAEPPGARAGLLRAALCPSLPSGGRLPTWRDLAPEAELPQDDVPVVPEGEAPAHHAVQQHAQGPDGGRVAAVAAEADPLGRAVGACS